MTTNVERLTSDEATEKIGRAHREMIEEQRKDSKHAALIAGLHAMADWYEAHPEMPAPITAPYVAYYPTHHAAPDEDVRATLARLARIMGRTQKEYIGDGADGWAALVMDFGGGVQIRLTTERRNVCTKRVIGIREVPAQTIPGHTEEIVEWDCGSVLKAEPLMTEAK